VLKVNNIAPVLGNAAAENARLSYSVSKGFTGIQLYGLYGVFGNPGAEADLAAFIAKARTVYGLKTIGCIMGIGNAGFIDALAYNASVPAVSRFNDFNKENEFWNYFTVYFTVTSAVVGFTYRITLNGTPYTYVAVLGDTIATIAAALAAACAPSGLNISIRSVNITNDTVRVRNTTSIYASFTWSNSANIADENIVETYTDWINSLIWLKANIGSNGIITAYVANPSNNWGVTEAEQMCANIDIYEGTNYTLVPDEGQNAYRNRQLVYIAQGAANIGKIQWHYPIFSAEWLNADPFATPPIPAPFPAPCGDDVNFMGYYLQTNGVATANSTWLAQYNADAIPNKASLKWVGYNYFSYNCLSLFVP
jgi:hypothetical protein